MAGRMASLGNTLLRQFFWLLGCPLLVLLALRARPRRATLLLWGMIASAYAYRLLVPKTVLATTGPIYVMEICLLYTSDAADE